MSYVNICWFLWLHGVTKKKNYSRYLDKCYCCVRATEEDNVDNKQMTTFFFATIELYLCLIRIFFFSKQITFIVPLFQHSH